MADKPNKRNRGSSGEGIAIGIVIGVALGAMLDQIAIGIALGIAIGAAIDGTRAKRAQDDSDSK